MSIKPSSSLNRNQQGIVSIMMTIVMILVISLIVLGLAQISRREVRKSTDSQLSTQAFYAAESGVNDVVNLIHANGDVVIAKPTCDLAPAIPYSTGLHPDIDTTSNVSYTCVIVEPDTTSIPGDASTTPSVYSLATTDAAGLSQVTLEWTPGGGKTTANLTNCPTTALGATNVFDTGSATDSWTCDYGVVRLDLVNTGTLTRDSLINNIRTYFLVPRRTGTVGSSTMMTRGVSCTSAKCSLTIAMPAASNDYYARISSIYTNAPLSIKGVTASGTTAKFADQVTIDVTGKAQDVLRRVKVSLNLNNGNQNGKAEAAIMSGDSICKRFKISDTGTALGDYAGFPGCN